VGQRGLFEGDEVSFGVGPLLAGERDETRTNEGIEESVEDFSVGGFGVAERAARKFSVEFSCGAGLTFECFEYGSELAGFFGRWDAEDLRGGALRGAEVAVAAGAEAVGGVTEVLDESGHTALRRFGKLDHAIDLIAAERELFVVTLAPCRAGGCDFGGTDVACDIDCGSALRDEFFYCLVERLRVHPEALTENVGELVVGGEQCGYACELGDCGVVALEKEVVHLAVGEGVEEDGAGWLAIASGAADLLVVLLDGTGKCGVDDSADVRLVDAHAEGDGGDDDLEFSGEELALDTLASDWVEAGVVGLGSVT